MKIKSFTIKNYRSIIKAYKVPLNEGLTVLVGKNNEGKSNILRALNGAFSVIKKLKKGGSYNYFHRMPRSIYRFEDTNDWYYDWERDFPISKQSNNRNKEVNTVFELVFSLNDKDREKFRNKVGSNCNEELPFNIKFDKEKFQ